MVKIGVVPANCLQNNLTARYYLDRCVHCGKKEADHVNGKCGSWQRIYVEAETSFEQAAKGLYETTNQDRPSSG